MTPLHGYGKTLDVDLSTGDVATREIDPEFARKYLGGMGFGLRILYDEVGPDVDPLSPANIVVFANGPLTGTQAPCAGRTEITTKSPLTGHIGTGNTGGVWGAALKHAGYDIITVRKQSDKPVFLWIDDDRVEIRDASGLWGKDTDVTTDILSAQLGAPGRSRVSVLAIGPAGENLVRYACPVNDYYHCAARGGAGAVMGAKRLKAIAVRGTGTVDLARPQEFRRVAKEARERLMESIRRSATGPGDVIPDIIELYQARGAMPYKNFQAGVLPEWAKDVTRSAAAKYCNRKEGTCYACPRSCFHLAEVKEGKYAGLKAGRGMHPGVVVDWGGKCALNNLPAIWKCKEVCQQLGMDEVSAAGVIAFAMELFQREIVTAKDAGAALDWGDEDAVVDMLHSIATRTGFGDVLAEGSERAAQRIGRGAERYVMTIKGMEKMSSDPRAGKKGWAFGEITNPRGGDNVKNTHFMADDYNPGLSVAEFDIFEDVKSRIYRVPLRELPWTWDAKPLMCRWFEDLFTVVNALGVCFFPCGMNLTLGPTHLSQLFSAATGWETTPQELMKSGERVFTLFKAYTVREGLTRKDDAWPDRLYEEPLPEGPSRGAVLSREEIDRLLDEYYDLRGWDKKSGIPTRGKLLDLGLDDVAEDLERLGKLPRSAEEHGSRTR